jgi:hypothetical protein
LFLHPILFFFALIPSDDLSQHVQKLAVTQEIPALLNEPCGINEVLSEKIDELQKLVIGFTTVIEIALDTVEKDVSMRILGCCG